MANAASVLPLHFSVWLHSAAAAQFQCASQVLAVQLASLRGLVAQCMAAPPAAKQPVPVLLPSEESAVATGRLAADIATGQCIAGSPVGRCRLAGPDYFQWKVDVFHMAHLGGALGAGPTCLCPNCPSPSALARPLVPHLGGPASSTG